MNKYSSGASSKQPLLKGSGFLFFGHTIQDSMRARTAWSGGSWLQLSTSSVSGEPRLWPCQWPALKKSPLFQNRAGSNLTMQFLVDTMIKVKLVC